jgi:hypothetical protein
MRNIIVALSGIAISFSGVAGTGIVDKPFQVFDANGKLIGRFYGQGTSGGAAMQMTVSQQRLLVGIQIAQDADGSYSLLGIDFAAGQTYYTTSDCSGQGYGSWPYYQLPTGVINITSSGKVLVYPMQLTKQTVMLAGYRDSQGNCFASQPVQQTVVPVDAPIDITGKYARPFTIE